MRKQELSPFGEWLMAEGAARNLTQTQLAHASGLSQGTVSLITRGIQQPRVTTCQALARGLNIPVENVLRQAGLMDPDPQRPVIPPDLRQLFEEIQQLHPELRAPVLHAWRSILAATKAALPDR